MFKKFLKNKRGELTTQQIVLLIILIASFIIILFFLFRLNLNSESEAEICHNSVVVRGSTVIPADATPLKCSRQYVCLTEDGSCEGFNNPVVEKVKTKNEVYGVLANEMANCWWMFGAGQVDYVGKDFFKKDNYCSICSQLLFDDSLKNIEGFENNEIDKDEFYDYLSETQYSNEKTYSEYLFRTNNLDLLKQELSKNQSADVTFGTIDIGKQYYVVMGITSEVSGRAWKIGAGVVAGGIAGFVFAPVTGIIVGAVIIGGGEIAGMFEPEIAAIPVEGDGVKNTFMAPTIVEVNSDAFEVLNCYDVNTLS